MTFEADHERHAEYPSEFCSLCRPSMSDERVEKVRANLIDGYYENSEGAVALESLEAELARLRAVAEAARTLVADWTEWASSEGLSLDEWPLLEALRTALSALEEK